jgi:hypothetical protein
LLKGGDVKVIMNHKYKRPRKLIYLPKTFKARYIKLPENTFLLNRRITELKGGNKF